MRTASLVVVSVLVVGHVAGMKREATFPICGNNTQHKFPFCVDRSYEKLMPPSGSGSGEETESQGDTQVVHVDLLLNDVEDISDGDHSITIHAKVTLRWNDERIEINDAYESVDPKGEILDQAMVRRLWTPDFSIYNLKKFDYAHIVKRLATLLIYENGTVCYGFQARITVGCAFIFDNFPMDKQECPFLVGSFGHTSESVIYDVAYYHPQEAQRPLPVTVKLKALTKKERLVPVKNKEGKTVAFYSVGGFKFLTKRSVMGKIFTTYFPASLGVFVSWISFTIDQEATAGRLALLVTLVMMQIMIYGPTTEATPPAQRMTAIEQFCLVCLVLTAGALMEYGLIICQKSDIQRASATTKFLLRKMGDSDDDEDSPRDSDEEEERFKRKRKGQRDEKREMDEWKKDDGERRKRNKGGGRSKPRKWCDRCRRPFTTDYIDNISIFLFPTIFIVYNFIYWSYYQNAERSENYNT